jgi:flagellar hook-associated protein 3 FlgL
MYSSFLFNMNRNLAAYMESNLQSSTQKKVNRPSDDPYGASQIMVAYSSLSSLTQYKDNLSMATGWLTQAESTLDQVQTQMERVLTIMQQGATGTYDATQRQTMGYEMRQILEQMVSYANSKFNGRYIFGGHNSRLLCFK